MMQLIGFINFNIVDICDIGIATCVNVIVLYERLVCFVGYIYCYLGGNIAAIPTGRKIFLW